MDWDALVLRLAHFSINFLWRSGRLAFRMVYTTLHFVFAYPKYIILAVVLILIAGLFMDEEKVRREVEKKTLTKDALIALQTVITPTFGHWPYGYNASLVSIRKRRIPPVARIGTSNDASSASSTSEGEEDATPQYIKIYTITVPILKFMTDCLRDYMEFRTPDRTEDFLYNRLQVYDWQIRLKAEPACLARLISWMVSSQESSLAPEAYIEKTMLPDRKCFVSLDVVPYAQISKILRHLEASLNPGDRAQLYFSTVVPDIDFLGPEYVTCAVPFFLREHSYIRPMLPDGGDEQYEPLYGIYKNIPSGPKRYEGSSSPRTYTSTPLLLSLVKVMRFLASAAPGLHVDAVKDVSEDARAALLREEKCYANDWAVRAAFNRKHGRNLRVLREERFMIAWEAGLLANGNLQRWCIKLKKPRYWARD